MTVCEELVWANGAYKAFDNLIIIAREKISSSNFDIFGSTFNVHPLTFGLHDHKSNDFREYPSMQNFIRYCTLAASHNITLDNKKQLVRLCIGHTVLLKNRTQKLRCCSLGIVIGDRTQYHKKYRKKLIFLYLLKGLNSLRAAVMKLFAKKYHCSNNVCFSLLNCMFIVNFYLNKNCLTLICIIEINAKKRENWIELLTEKEQLLTEIFKFFDSPFNDIQSSLFFML